HLRRELYMQLFERSNLLLGESSDAAGDLEFGGQVLSQYDPASAALAGGQFEHHWLPALNRKPGAQLFCALALPGDFQSAGADLRLQPLLRLVVRQVARQALTCAGSRQERG